MNFLERKVPMQQIREKQKKVVKLIDVLGTITKDSKEAVQKARNAYEKLTANDKVYVTNYDKLKKSRRKITKIAEKFKGIGDT